ncbi:LMCD1 protein, partial [Leucopsar rothschildi]|nr:LMCD1 protein [Leucopsar rothschildi]
SGRGVPCLRCRGLCTGFEPHSWRKMCKSCRCSQEEHGLSSELDEDRKLGQLLAGSRYSSLTARLKGGDGARLYKRNRMIVTNPNISGKDPTFDTVTYEWAPPGLTQKLAMQYMELVPPELQPVAGTEGAWHRRRRLARQLPLHDQDPAQCRGLGEGEQPLMEEFVRKYKAEALGVGEVALPGQGGAGKEEEKPQDKNTEARGAPESPNGALESTTGTGNYGCSGLRESLGIDSVTSPAGWPVPHPHPAPRAFSMPAAAAQSTVMLWSSSVRAWRGSLLQAALLSTRVPLAGLMRIIFSEDYQQVEGLAWHNKHFACLECETLLLGKPFALANASLLCTTCSQSR